jgi:hypothetical protein
MKITTIGTLSLIGLISSIAPVWAGAVSVQGNLSSNQRAAAVTQLEAQREQASREMATPPYNKGPLLIHNMDRASKLDDLINRVQSGEPVSPDEIDQALQPSSR